jgi:hypothetical protein
VTYAEFVAGFLTDHPEVAESQMFGMPCLKFGGKAILGDWEGSAVFKLDPADVDGVLEIEGAHLFEPMGGRPMKQWVVVPSAQADSWDDLGSMALDYAASQAK